MTRHTTPAQRLKQFHAAHAALQKAFKKFQAAALLVAEDFEKATAPIDAEAFEHEIAREYFDKTFGGLPGYKDQVERAAARAAKGNKRRGRGVEEAVKVVPK